MNTSPERNVADPHVTVPPEPPKTPPAPALSGPPTFDEEPGLPPRQAGEGGAADVFNPSELE